MGTTMSDQDRYKASDEEGQRQYVAMLEARLRQARRALAATRRQVGASEPVRSTLFGSEPLITHGYTVDQDGKLGRMTVAVDLELKTWGVAFCRHGDAFNPKMGATIAVGRARCHRTARRVSKLVRGFAVSRGLLMREALERASVEPTTRFGREPLRLRCFPDKESALAAIYEMSDPVLASMATPPTMPDDLITQDWTKPAVHAWVCVGVDDFGGLR